MLTTPTEKTAFVNQKLPTEIIGIICEFTDLKTHTAIRSTCLSVRTYVPVRKVVGFEEYRKLVGLSNFGRFYSLKDNERRRVFQERFNLALHHEALTHDQVEYLTSNGLDYELCRIARKVLDQPDSYKGINLLFDGGFFLAVAAPAGDLTLLIRLLQVPLMNPAARCNRAIRYAAIFGRLEVVQFLLQVPRINPSDKENDAIVWASTYGHLSIVQLLLQDPRVDPSDCGNDAFRRASKNGHAAVVQALLQDPRVNPSDLNNEAIIMASLNGHLAVVQELLQDPRVDPSHLNNNAYKLASENGHTAVVQALLQDERVSSKARRCLAGRNSNTVRLQ